MNVTYCLDIEICRVIGYNTCIKEKISAWKNQQPSSISAQYVCNVDLSSESFLNVYIIFTSIWQCYSYCCCRPLCVIVMEILWKIQPTWRTYSSCQQPTKYKRSLIMQTKTSQVILIWDNWLVTSYTLNHVKIQTSSHKIWGGKVRNLTQSFVLNKKKYIIDFSPLCPSVRSQAVVCLSVGRHVQVDSADWLFCSIRLARRLACRSHRINENLYV